MSETQQALRYTVIPGFIPARLTLNVQGPSYLWNIWHLEVLTLEVPRDFAKPRPPFWVTWSGR